MTDFDSKALWEDLQAEEERLRAQNADRHRREQTHFWRTKKVYPRQKTTRKRTPKWGASVSTRQQPTCDPQPIEPRNIKHAINLLNDSSDRLTRLSCLHHISAYLSSPTKTDHDPKMDTTEILKCLIKTFVDPKEPIRSLAIDVVHKHIGSEHANWDYQVSIKYIIPIILHCVCGSAYFEKSEEIRLKLVGLLDRIVSLSSNEEDLKPICGDLIAILMKLLVDSHSDINQRVCSLIVALSGKIRVYTVSTMVIETVLPLLSHRKSPVRVSAIRLIECMLMNGGHEAIQKLTGFREHNVVPIQWWFGGESRANYFGALCRHKNASVRSAFYEMIFNVMTNMRERYDYKTLLLSYVLSGLQDESRGIQEKAFSAIEVIGTMHERDDYNDLKRTLFFQKQAEEIKMRVLGDDDHSNLPFPFKKRPCLGSRILIREHFSRIVHAALSEFNDWKSDCREMAVQLVRNMLIYSEEYCTQNTELLLEALRKLVHDQNEMVAECAKECCTLIGRYVYPMIWIDYISDLLFHESDRSLIEVLKCLVEGCPMRKLKEFVPRLVSLLEHYRKLNGGFNHKNVANSVREILDKLKTTNDLPGIESVDREQVDDGFEFSSEYLGFSLQIIDECGTDDSSSTNDLESLSERIDRMLTC